MKQKLSLFTAVLAGCIVFATQARATQSPPTFVLAAPGNQSAAVTFLAPPADNGSAISGYTVISDPGGGVDSNANSDSRIHVITGLTNGQTYKFRVEAINSLSETSKPSRASNTVTPSSALYSQLAGQWNLGGLISGQDAPQSQSCTMTVDQDGTASGACSVNGVASPNFTGNLWLFPDCVRQTLNLANQASQPLIGWRCYPNPDGTFMSCTGTVNDGSGSSYMSVATKEGASYSASSDLPGQWVSQSLDIGASSSNWSSEDVTVQGGGSYSGTQTTSSAPQSPTSVSGVLALSSTGALSSSSGSLGNGPIGSMDADKTIVAGANTNMSNNVAQDAELRIVLKNADSYSAADLTGDWKVNTLSSDGAWKRDLLLVDRDGMFVNFEANSDGTHGLTSGILAISSTGVVSCAQNQPSWSSCSNVNLVMDAGKTVMAGVKTSSSGAVYSLSVAAKNQPSWEWVSWFGSFYTGSFPWLYHSQHGFLYVLGAPTGLWFYDFHWNKNHGGWWWTNASTYPWLYSSSENSWLWFDENDSTIGNQWFFNNGNHGWATH